jgi:hypothetical protein
MHQRPWGIWSLSSENALDSPMVEDHILFLLELLEPKGPAVEQLKASPGFLIQLYVWHVGEAGFSLSSSVLQRACSICHSINFSFFSQADEES